MRGPLLPFLPGGVPGAGWIYGVHPGRFLPGSIRPGARVGPLPGYTDSPPLCTSLTPLQGTRAISAGRKCHMVNMRPAGVRGPDRRIIPGSVSVSVSGGPIRSHPINIAESPEYGRPPPVGWSPNRVRSGRLPIRSHPINPIRSSPAGGCESCTGRAAAPFPLGAETSRAGRLEGVRVFSGTAGTCRVRVRNPGALCGRLGAGVVAYVPLIRAYVTLSRAPRETALYPVHCFHSSLPGRYASAAYTPVCGGTTGNMRHSASWCGMVRFGAFRYGSPCPGCQAGRAVTLQGTVSPGRGPAGAPLPGR